MPPLVNFNVSAVCMSAERVFVAALRNKCQFEQDACCRLASFGSGWATRHPNWSLQPSRFGLFAVRLPSFSKTEARLLTLEAGTKRRLNSRQFAETCCLWLGAGFYGVGSGVSMLSPGGSSAVRRTRLRARVFEESRRRQATGFSWDRVLGATRNQIGGRSA